MFKYIDYDVTEMQNAFLSGRNNWIRFWLQDGTELEAYVDCETEIGDTGDDSNDEPALLLMKRDGTPMIVGCTQIKGFTILEKL